MTTTPTPTPPNTQPTQSNGQSIASSVKLYKPTDLTDIGWRWNSLQDLKNKKKVTCDFCGEESTGGITRAKQHQMGVGGQVKGCLKTPDNVKKQLREADEKKKAAKAAMAGEVNENADDIADLQEISRIRSGKRPVESGSMPAAQKKTKGPLDALYYQKPEDTIEKGKQTSINDIDKEARAKKLESELVRNGVTRFATTFLTLHRLHQLKAKIRTMFTSQEWLNLNASKEVKGKKAAAIVLQVSFWDDIVFALKAMGPLVKVLRLVDNEKRPAMGSIYQAMVEARENIVVNFNNNESKYKQVIDIVDRRWSIQLHHPLHAAGHYLNPKYFYCDPLIENDSKLLDGLYTCIDKLSESDEVVDSIHGELSKYRMGVGHFGLKEAIRQRATIAAAEWWKRYGAKTRNLQLLAIKILSLTCSSSGCERNWSAFEHIHSKKRNRLEHQKLQDLVFIKYNQTLKERYDSNDVIDPVVMDDDIDGNEWLLGDEVEAQAQPDLVFDDDDLSWLDVDLASGAAEPTINTRSQAKTATTPAPRPPLHPASSSRTKKSRKDVVVVNEEDEFDDLDYVGDEEDEVHEEESSGEGSDDEETMNFNDS
ncbi:hypothetical protein QL285_027902 [Trifolium repens]|nr:hypothetical protein QL285_027902 [Trifolium repens]